jgi:hypothetical protein
VDAERSAHTARTAGGESGVANCKGGCRVNNVGQEIVKLVPDVAPGGTRHRHWPWRDQRNRPPVDSVDRDARMWSRQRGLRFSSRYDNGNVMAAVGQAAGKLAYGSDDSAANREIGICREQDTH